MLFEALAERKRMDRLQTYGTEKQGGQLRESAEWKDGAKADLSKVSALLVALINQ